MDRPNLDEVRFGTPLNQKFGKTIVAKGLRVATGYQPGSDLSRQQVAFANVYWAKQIAPSLGLFRTPDVVTTEPVSFSQIKDKVSDSLTHNHNHAHSPIHSRAE